MKQILKTSVVLTCALLLGACSSAQNNSTSTSGKTENTSEKSSSTEEKKVDYNLYDGVIDKYAEVMGSSSVTPAADINPEARAIYETTDKGITYQSQGYQGIGYTLVDLDNNGTDELVISLLHKDANSLLDIYTIKDKKLIRLTSVDQGMDKIGVHQAVRLLPDGKFLFVAGPSMFNRTFLVYQINAAGDSFEDTFKAESLNEVQEKFGKELDLKSYDWTLVTERPGASKKSTPSSSSAAESGKAKAATPASTGMDITAIQNGDFSSVVGTWKSANGGTLVFDKNGLVDDNVYVNLENSKIENDFLSSALYPKEPVPSVVRFYFIPKGVVLPAVEGYGKVTYADESDASRERLLPTGQPAGQSNAALFYYKVE